MSDDWNIAFYRADLTPYPRDPVSHRTLRSANIGESYWPAGVEKIPADLSYRADLQRIIGKLHESAQTGLGAIFFGLYGHGKTSAAAICLKSALCRGGMAYMVEALTLRAAHDKPQNYLTNEGVPVWDMARRCHFVAIDDLGAEQRVEYGQPPDTRVVEELIRYRYSRKLPTFITTNLSVQALMVAYQDLKTIFLDPSRYEIVEVRGKNWRQGEA